MLWFDSPKVKRNLSRIVPFGIIWLVIGWIFLLSETIATGNQNLTPDSAVTVTLPVFIFASIAVTLAGLLFGIVELVFLEKRFRYYSFARKVIYKFLIYLFFTNLIIVITFPIATSIEQGLSILDQQVWIKTRQFFLSLVFVNTIVQLSFHILISLLYAAISENLGHNVFVNFFTGKYHTPKMENRIFMFLDMKDSTTIAEKLGHKTYFSLLQDYYELMSEIIISHEGEVYQYIGDEVVITWQAKKGINDANCLNCFNKLKLNLAKQESFFFQKFGIVPDFKAGMHIGEVTTGEIGALKKEIVYTGDVLNTTARVQGLCKEYQTDLIITEDILKVIEDQEPFTFQLIGEVALKGKTQVVRLYALKD